MEKLDIVSHERAILRTVLFSYLAYNLGHFVSGWFLAMKGSWRASKRRYRAILWERLFVHRLQDAPLHAEAVYAVGLGELRVAAKFLQVLQSERGVKGIVLCETDDLIGAGYEGVKIYPAPFNNPLSVLKALLILRPRVIWIVESLHNHHLKAVAAYLRIPTIVLNAQDSVRREVEGRGSSWRVPLIGLYAAQSQSPVEILTSRLVDPKFVRETGPVGMGLPSTNRTDCDLSARYRSLFELDPNCRPVIVAGSTYEGDEVAVLGAFVSILSKWPKAKLILAPRGMHRVPRVAELAGRTGLSFRLRSRPLEPPDASVIILDSMGELRDAYCVADLAFVGGTFESSVGGHTPIEAFAWKIPISSGPYFAHQTVSMELLQSRGLLSIARSSAELYEFWVRSFEDKAFRQRIPQIVDALQAEFDSKTVAVYDQIHREYGF